VDAGIFEPIILMNSILVKKLKEKGILTEEDIADMYAELIKRLYPDKSERIKVWNEIKRHADAQSKKETTRS